MEGSIIRSKEQWIELGEKPTKYFYQVEHKHQSRNVISELRVALPFLGPLWGDLNLVGFPFVFLGRPSIFCPRRGDLNFGSLVGGVFFHFVNCLINWSEIIYNC